MKIVCISDTHSLHKQLELPAGDMILHGGDFSKMGREHEVRHFLDWFSELPYRHKIFIAGNHDFLAEKQPAIFRSMIPDNCIYLENTSVNIEGINIWGSPITPWFFDWAFNRRRGKDIDRYWQQIPDSVDILITHGPPMKILDRTAREVDAGCEDLRNRIAEVRPKMHLFGHIHEAYGSQETDGCLFLNASVVNLQYQLVNAPMVLDWREEIQHFPSI